MELFENNQEVKKEEVKTAPKRKNYRIKSVFLRNFMGAKDGTYNFDGKSVFLCAKNAKGKTDLMTAIVSSLQNIKLEKPIKAGEKEGSVVITLVCGEDEYRLEVFYMGNDKEQVHYFELTSPDGFSTREVKGLKQLVGGNIGFDVEKFVRNTSNAPGMRENIAIIKKFLGEAICAELQELDDKYAMVKETRERENKRITELRGILSSKKYTEQDIFDYSSPKDIVALNAEYRAALEGNTGIASVQKEIYDLTSKISGYESDIKAIEAEIEAKKKQLTEKSILLDKERVKKVELEEKIASMPKYEGKTAESIEAEIKQADTFNKKVAEIEKYMAEKSEYEERYKKWNELGKKYAEIEDQKRKVLTESPLPVKGLSFDENGIYIQLPKNAEPIPISQLSTAERTRLIAVPLAIAENPKVKLIHIGNAESMDFDTLTEIQKYADENDYQVFYEEVDRAEEDIVIRFAEDVIK